MRRRVKDKLFAHLHGVGKLGSKDVESESGRKFVVGREVGEGWDEVGVFLWSDALDEELDVLEEDFRRLRERAGNEGRSQLGLELKKKDATKKGIVRLTLSNNVERCFICASSSGTVNKHLSLV